MLRALLVMIGWGITAGCMAPSEPPAQSAPLPAPSPTVTARSLDYASLADGLLRRDKQAQHQLYRLRPAEARALVEPLIRAIAAERDPDTRALGVWALGDLGRHAGENERQQAIPFLIDVIALGVADPRRQDSNTARSALLAYGDEGVAPLIDAMSRRGTYELFADVLENYVRQNGDETVRRVVAALKHDSLSVRRGAVIALRSLSPSRREYVPAILAAFDDTRDKKFRGQMAVIFANLGPAAVQAVPSLKRVLQDREDYYLRRTAAAALGAIGEAARPAVPDLIPLLKDERCDVRESAAGALARIDGPDAQGLLQAYEHCKIEDV